VVRTDFTNEVAWERVVEELRKPRADAVLLPVAGGP
jgi:hypothetical protein